MERVRGSGAYDQWLTFERMPQPEAQDDFGGLIGVPVVHFESWGAFEPLGGREFPATQKRFAETTARFRIPYQEITIDPALHRVVMDFDSEASPPNRSTWNVEGTYGDRFETTVEVSEVK